MARNRFRNGRPTTPRLTEWAGITFSSTVFTATGGTILGSLNAAALALRPFTIIRTHVELFVLSDQSAAIEFQAGAFGMAVVSDQASAIGVTAVPTPVTDSDSDLFFVHQVFFADESNLTDRTKGGNHYSIDSKAMRKVNGDQDLIISAELSDIGSGFRLLVGGRFLLKLH